MIAKKKQAWKSRLLVPHLLSARGATLFDPLPALENGVILAENGLIQDVGSNLAIPVDYELTDYGDAIIAPPLVNAHTHLQLSWLRGLTEWGSGYTAWLSSMLPHLFSVIKSGFGGHEKEALRDAIASLISCGTGHGGDVGGSITGALSASYDEDLPLSHFCEWFGFAEKNGRSPWPERCEAEILANHHEDCWPCGHALYSTSIAHLQRAQAWCESKGAVFTFHLAESPEETEMLATGTGPLAELYSDVVLPADWCAEGLSPFRMAHKYGLLKRNTLAVHGVQLAEDEIRDFADTGAALCLCPRSNRNLAVGIAPVLKLIDAGILLCLGTDGLVSCEDLDVRNDAAYLQSEFDLPMPALLRLAIANGRAALGLKAEALEVGKKARFSVWQL